MIISVADSRFAKVWRRTDISWEKFLKKIDNTTRTQETIEEYKKMNKGKQDSIKDVGGFVAGSLKEGKRRNGYVEFRSMLTLDMDYGTKDIWDEITMFFDFKCCIYSTHKSTVEKPRYRLIIPLSRNVTEEEYPAVARMVASTIGIELFDDTTYEATRLMYWPSTSSDGVYTYENQDGELLNPDIVLPKYSNWKDVSSWPMSSRQIKLVKTNISKQADPLLKEGIIGVFCRTYSIEEAIDAFISDVYRPSVITGRYDYVKGESSAGVVIYDDKFAYSHHATDPGCNKLMNAFDVVRIHKFGQLDLDKDSDLEVSKFPSFKAMQELASNDNKVKTQILNEKRKLAQTEFTPLEDWHNKLEYSKQGNIINNLRNLIIILNNDEKLKSIVFNELSDGMEINGEVPWSHPSKFWRDADDAQLISYIDLNYGNFSARNYDIAVSKVADDRSYHPIKEYLNSLPCWDGIKRVDTLLIDYLGAEDSKYVRAVTRKTLCAAIARVKKPGCKFDTMLVLCGPQGKGKSTLISKLSMEWFSDSMQLSETKDKTAAEKLQGYWVLEIGELAGLRKAEVETLRGFLSRQNDIYRASFGRRAVPHPRQCIFIGTTNAENGYLRDTTGNRRFWPVKTPGSGAVASWKLTYEEVQQIWAETLVYYEAGELLYLEKDTAVVAEKKQREAMEGDDRVGMVQEYLELLLPDNWDEMNIYERRNFINGNEFGGNEITGVRKRERVCNMEIFCECFGKDRGNFKRQDANDIAAIMAKIENWDKAENKMRFSIYGVVSGYIRVANSELP